MEMSTSAPTVPSGAAPPGSHDDVVPSVAPLSTLLTSARQASRALRQRPRPDATAAAVIAETMSDELAAAARTLGVDTAEGWRLLDLRDWLDAHVLAAAALDGTGVREDVVLDLLGRAVIDLVVRLSRTGQ